MKSLRQFRGTERFGYRKGLQLLSSLNEFAGTVNEHEKALVRPSRDRLGAEKEEARKGREGAMEKRKQAEAIVLQMRLLQIGSSMTIV
jgi:hypothetical protein